MKGWEIVGYTFQGDSYCPEHVTDALASTEEYDGWRLAEGAAPMSAEDDLDEIAHAFGIDRTDESTFDSWEFPKVIFADMAEDTACDSCPGRLTLI